MSDNTSVPAICKMDSIFNLLFTEPNGLTQAEISNSLKMPKATVFRLISALNNMCYLDLDVKSSRYTLGVKLLTLGNIVNTRLNLNEIAAPVIDRLSGILSEMVKLSIIRSNVIFPIYTCECKKPIRITLDSGAVFPPYVGAAGKLLLAMTSAGQSYLEDVLPHIKMNKLTPKTITNEKEIKKVIEQIRKEKVAYDNQEESEGIFAISAPIYNSDSEVIAALSIPFFGDKDEKIGKYLTHLLKGADDISRLLGYTNIKI